ncbi:unnamed protein product, partial [Urochloa humidicola]
RLQLQATSCCAREAGAALRWPNEAQANIARVWGETRLRQLAGRACSDRACRRAVAGGPGPSASSSSRACGASCGQQGGAIRELWWPAQGSGAAPAAAKAGELRF